MSVSVMKKLTVLAPKRDVDGLMRRLIRLKCVEIRTVSLEELPDRGALLRYDCATACATAERRVADVRTALDLLDGYYTAARPWKKRPISVRAEAFRATGSFDAASAVVEEVLQIREARAACRREYNRLNALRQALAPWQKYDTPLSETSTDLCEIWLGRLPSGVVLTDEGSPAQLWLDGMSIALEEVPQTEWGRGQYVSVLFLRSEEESATKFLAEVGFERITFADLPSPGTAEENDRLCVRRIAELENLLQSYTDRLIHLSQMLDDVAVLCDIETTTLIAAREKEKLAATEQCVLMEAWVPDVGLARVESVLRSRPCAYDFTDPADGEDPPVLLRNNAFAANFEWVVGMYAYPKYGTYDPTFIMSIFYFFIFGIMFADVGYGSLLILAGFLGPRLLRMSDGLKRMLNMFGYCGISCVLLGIVFGGWFGDLPYALMTTYFGYESAEAAKEAMPLFNGLVVTFGGEPIVFNPLENPILFLVISLVIGGVHLITGMAVKFVLLCKEGHVFAAIFDVGSYWVLFAGIGLIFVSPLVGWIVLAVGVLMIVCTYGRAQKHVVMKFLMGLKGLYDLISYASDLLSYCRILALGLAAGVVGQVINLLATMGGPGPGGFVLMVAILLVGHGLNLAINILGSFVHTSRLQYLEFFGKFYEDGGTIFKPALPSTEYSTVECDEDEALVSASNSTPKKSAKSRAQTH